MIAMTYTSYVFKALLTIIILTAAFWRAGIRVALPIVLMITLEMLVA